MVGKDLQDLDSALIEEQSTSCDVFGSRSQCMIKCILVLKARTVKRNSMIFPL